MEQRISAVTLGVRDLAASKKFYREGLGWEPVFENSEIAFFQIVGLVFALYRRDEFAADFKIDPQSIGNAAMALSHNVRSKNEVDPLMERAASAGAKILKPAKDASWGGYSGYFTDPDGFAWEIAWNPFWLLEEDGTVKFRNGD
jgi:predicted lactoylglutathione lyase